VKSYVTNTINLSCAKIFLPSVMCAEFWENTSTIRKNSGLSLQGKDVATLLRTATG